MVNLLLIVSRILNGGNFLAPTPTESQWYFGNKIDFNSFIMVLKTNFIDWNILKNSLPKYHWHEILVFSVRSSELIRTNPYKKIITSSAWVECDIYTVNRGYSQCAPVNSYVFILQFLHHTHSNKCFNNFPFLTRIRFNFLTNISEFTCK